MTLLSLAVNLLYLKIFVDFQVFSKDLEPELMLESLLLFICFIVSKCSECVVNEYHRHSLTLCYDSFFLFCGMLFESETS